MKFIRSIKKRNNKKRDRINIFSSFFIFTLLITVTSCSSDKEGTYPIPKDASIVTVINTGSIGKKVLLDKIGEFSFSDLFKTSKPGDTTQKDTLTQILEDPEKIGIDVLENIYGFYKNNLIGIIASIDDQDKAPDYFKKYKNAGGLNFLYVKNICLAWNKDFCIFLFHQDMSPVNEKEILALSDLKKQDFFFQQEGFKLEEQRDADAYIWIHGKKLSEEFLIARDISQEFLKNNFSLTTINFEEGKTDIETTDLINPENIFIESPVDVISFKSFADIVSDRDRILKSSFKLNLDKISGKFQQSEKATKKLNISADDFKNAFSGEVNFSIFRIDQIKRIFQTYTFDDDFNKIEKTDTATIIYPGFEVFLKNQDSQIVNKLLKSLEAKNLIRKGNGPHKYDSYRFDLIDPAFDIVAGKEATLISNQYGYIPANFNYGKQEELVYFYLTGNFQTLHEELKSIDFNYPSLEKLERFYFRIQNNESKKPLIKFEILFTDKEKNSFLSIIEVIKGTVFKQM
ncbi:MAG: DUF4836 family protein [Cytophagaceae bacterium]|nr:DUF4836 family protein [Cytophagaceae bacterium]